VFSPLCPQKGEKQNRNTLAQRAWGKKPAPHAPGAGRAPPPPAQGSTFKEKAREQASARLQRHTCRKQPLPQIELISSLY